MPQRALAIAARDGKFEAEGWRVRKDGTRFWAFVIIDAIYDNGELIGFAKITRDLTERRQAEEELRRSEELFRRLVEGVTDYAIYMLDPSGIVSNWNAGAQRIKGYGPDEIVGQHFSIFYTDEDRSRGEPARSLAIAEREGRFEAEAWRQRKDGTRFWANVVIDAIRDPSGRLIGFAKITRDITERREAQLALERTREALLHSQKIEAIGKLTGGVAHDFNNLLTVVLGSLDLLRRYLPNDDPRITRLLDNALQGAQRGATLTQRMLAFARRQELDLRAGRPGRADARHARPAAALARAADHHRNPLPARPRQCDGRSAPARDGAAQSRRQCARCHAGRRHPDHRRPQRGHGGRRQAARPGAMSG